MKLRQLPGSRISGAVGQRDQDNGRRLLVSPEHRVSLSETRPPCKQALLGEIAPADVVVTDQAVYGRRP